MRWMLATAMAATLAAVAAPAQADSLYSDGPLPFHTVSAWLPVSLVAPSSSSTEVTRYALGLHAEFALPLRRHWSLDLGGGLTVRGLPEVETSDGSDAFATAYEVAAGVRRWFRGRRALWFVGASAWLSLWSIDAMAGSGDLEPGAALDVSGGVVVGNRPQDLVQVVAAIHVGASSPTSSLGAGVYLAPLLGVAFMLD